MDETKMSVMQKLRAIRDRIATQPAEEKLQASGGTVSPQPSGNVTAFGNTAPAPVPPPQPAPPAPTPSAASMWDLVGGPDAAPEPPRPAVAVAPARPSVAEFVKPAPQPPAAAPASTAREAEAPRKQGRVKTRLLGFENVSGTGNIDLAEKPIAPKAAGFAMFPHGWMIVVSGPGRGASYPLLTGVSQIGRDEDQAVQLDFGDTSISRSNHAAIAFDDEERSFFIGHGGKSNLVRLNGKPLLSTERLRNGDMIRIGETMLRLVTLCDESFSWTDPA
jgi:hypothetical protein